MELQHVYKTASHEDNGHGIYDMESRRMWGDHGLLGFISRSYSLSDKAPILYTPRKFQVDVEPAALLRYDLVHWFWPAITANYP